MVETNKMIDIGQGSVVNSARLLAVVQPDAAPIRRLVREARERFTLVDATGGKKTASVLIMDSDHVILSSLNVEHIQIQI